MISFRSLFVPIALAASMASVHAQTVTVDVSDGAVQRFEIAGPARISYTGSTVVISFGLVPTPTPIDPPVPPGPKPPPPVVTWGPPARAVVLYEADKITPGEVWYDPAFGEALDGVFGKERRYWDDDLEPPAEPVWSEAMVKAKAKRPAGTDDPILYAFDAQGRIQELPLRTLSVENTIAAIKAMRTKD